MFAGIISSIPWFSPTLYTSSFTRKPQYEENDEYNTEWTWMFQTLNDLKVSQCVEKFLDVLKKKQTNKQNTLNVSAKKLH